MDLSENVLMKTFSHLELKCLDACRLVCRWWSSIIDSPIFQRRFHSRSSTQPRLVLTFYAKDSNTRSRSLYSPSHLCRGPHEDFRSRRSRQPPVGYDCVHGLICDGSTIINPSLGLEFELPLISPTDSEEHRILGFEPISFRHKLLALRVDKRTRLGDYQVHTLGDDSKKWRIVNSATPELPKTKGICINGMIFYFILRAGTCSLVRFNVAAETIEFFPVPEQTSHSVGKHLDKPNTVLEYKTKLAFVSPVTDNFPACTFGMWVLDDVEKQLWTRLSFSINDQLSYYRSLDLGAMSVNRETGEIVLAASGMSWTIYFVFIDVDTKSQRQILIEDYKSLSRLGFAIRDYSESCWSKTSFD